ncbi:MAG TPA: adenylate/guanylate cyclase domain-containing protein [Candidatus Acidoferrales bacterium]|jgi:adenylate cyclase|nr:adenylate/guanylate cyclase domain-containing protein [Candidatus Acidoferrales bacterium]
MFRIVHSYNGTEKVFQSAETPIIIGRTSAGTVCHLSLSPDFKVSRQHARIILEDNEYRIEDLDSKQGTKVNDEEIRGRGKQALRAGDVLVIGETTLRVESASPPGFGESFAPNEDTMMPPTMANLEPAEVIGTTMDVKMPSTFEVEPGATEGERRLALLYELPLKLAKESQLDSMLQKIVEHLVEVIPGATRAALLFSDPQTGGLVLKAHLPVGEPAVRMTLAQRAVTRREGFIWRFDEQDTNTTFTNVPAIISTGMYAPLVWREKAVGVICVDNPTREKMFAKEDLRLLMAVAHYGAMAVAHQRALDDLTRHADLTNRLFSSRFAPHLRQKLVNEAANGSLSIGTRQSQITILMADIRGFTKLTALLGARRTGDLLNEYFPLLFDTILAHDGTVEQVVGDAIFAVFGSPEPDNRQQEKAVRAALAMQAASASAMKSRLERKMEICEIGIGIHCGNALHGFIGNAERLEYTVIGEPANLASRYCSAAGKGEILISPEIHAHVFNKFALERTEIPTKHEGTIVAYRIKK